MKTAASLLIAILLTVSLYAQEKPLTNKEIVSLSQIGLGSDVIAAKIQKSRTSFDTSVDALKELKNAGVPDSVILAMIEATESGSVAHTAAQPMQAPAQSQRQIVTPPPGNNFAPATFNSAPVSPSVNATGNASPINLIEFGDLSELAGVTSVYVWADDFEDRKVIVNELAKASSLLIADSPENADFVLILQMSERRMGTKGGWFLDTYIVASDKRYIGEMVALRRGQGNFNGRPRLRIVWSTRKIRDVDGAFGITFNRHPAVNGTRQFLKEFAKVKSAQPSNLKSNLSAEAQNNEMPSQDQKSIPISDFVNSSETGTSGASGKNEEKLISASDVMKARRLSDLTPKQPPAPRKNICAQNGVRVPCPEEKP